MALLLSASMRSSEVLQLKHLSRSILAQALQRPFPDEEAGAAFWRCLIAPRIGQGLPALATWGKLLPAP